MNQHNYSPDIKTQIDCQPLNRDQFTRYRNIVLTNYQRDATLRWLPKYHFSADEGVDQSSLFSESFYVNMLVIITNSFFTTTEQMVPWWNLDSGQRNWGVVVDVITMLTGLEHNNQPQHTDPLSSSIKVALEKGQSVSCRAKNSRGEAWLRLDSCVLS